jgi:DNA polymerase epsilon subunit 1
MAGMERRLVCALQQHVREYQLQDLQCVRCRAVTARHLRGACGRCGAELCGTLLPSLFRKRLTVFRSVAVYHGFPVLQQQADWLLAAPPPGKQ